MQGHMTMSCIPCPVSHIPLPISHYPCPIAHVPLLMSHCPCPVSRDYTRDSQRNSCTNTGNSLKTRKTVSPSDCMQI
ncbi:uncharacterized protein K444DRAFT_708369, partial [Hyaloscypha bicolor E]